MPRSDSTASQIRFDANFDNLVNKIFSNDPQPQSRSRKPNTKVEEKVKKATIPVIVPPKADEAEAPVPPLPVPPLKDRVSVELSDRVEPTAKKIVPLFSLAKSAYYLATFRLAKARPHFHDARQGFAANINRFFNFLKSPFKKTPKNEDEPKAASRAPSQHDVNVPPVHVDPSAVEAEPAIPEPHLLPNGAKFQGEVDAEGLPTGMGEMILKDSTIIGKFVKGIPVGQVQVITNDEVKDCYFSNNGDCCFEGIVEDGRILRPTSGKGQIKIGSAIYDGEFVEGIFINGTRTRIIGNEETTYFYNKDGDEDPNYVEKTTPQYHFKGELKDEKPFQGVLVRKTDLGEVSINITAGIEGRSTLTYNTEEGQPQERFNGILTSDDQPYTGNGVVFLDKGVKYTGEYVEGACQGKGTKTFPDGRTFQAEWFHDVFMPGELTISNNFGDTLVLKCVEAGKFPLKGTFYFVGENGTTQYDYVEMDEEGNILKADKALLRDGDYTFIGEIDNGVPVKGRLSNLENEFTFFGTIKDFRPYTGSLYQHGRTETILNGLIKDHNAYISINWPN